MKKLLNKWHSLPDSTKSSLVFMLSSFLITGLNFITTPLFTRVMDSEQYGIVATYNSWLFIIDVFALLGLTSAGVFNIGLNDYKDTRNKYISSTLILCNLTTVIVFATLFGVKFLLGEGFILPTNLLVLMFIHFIFNPANVFWITREKYEYRYKLSALITVCSTVLAQVVSLLFVVFAGRSNTSEIKLWSHEITLLLFYIPIYVYILRNGRCFVNLKRWKQTLLLALPLIPHYLAQHVMTSADMIMISEIVGDTEAAIYSVVSNIGKVATIAWSAINVTFIAISFEAFNRKEYSSLRRTATMLIAAYGALCILVCLLAPEILMVLAPAEYAHGVYAVPPIACVAFICGLYNVYGNVEFYYKKTVLIAIATVASAVLNIVLNMLLIPVLGLFGAAYATMLSYILLIFMHYVGYRCSTKERIYNNKTILLISAIIIGSCMMSSFLYLNSVIRYSVLAIVLVGILIKHKSIYQRIKGFTAKPENREE